jgi:cell division protein ZapA
MDVELKPVKISIGGEDYFVRGDVDSQTIQQIAEFVNRKIREVAEKTPHQPNNRVSILAALNIAEELFQEKKAREKQLQEYENRANRLLEWLDHKLAEVTA